MEHLYTKKQAAQLRQKLIDSCIVAIVKANLNKYPQLKSAALLVAQYWNDEASDAVHHRLIYSILDTPDLEAAAKARMDYAEDPVNLPGISDDFGDLIDEVDYIKSDTEPYYWNDNHEAIPAFAAFCKEGCHQEMDGIDAYSPYAILRRQGDDIEIEVVGKMLRPWLDGIKPERD